MTKCKRCEKETQNTVLRIFDFGEHVQIPMHEACDEKEKEEHRIEIEKWVDAGHCDIP